jgi:hypothetical protein
LPAIAVLPPLGLEKDVEVVVVERGVVLVEPADAAAEVQTKAAAAEVQTKAADKGKGKAIAVSPAPGSRWVDTFVILMLPYTQSHSGCLYMPHTHSQDSQLVFH